MRRTLAIVMASLSGCALQSQVPYPENHAFSYQKVLGASRHWDLLASDTAEQAKAALTPAPNRLIYVDEAIDKTDFNRAFRNLLVTKLLEKGLAVASRPENALTVNVDTQVITHRSERFAYRPGTLTALAAGILVLRNIIPDGNSTERGLAFLGLAGAGDVITTTHAGPPPKTEVIVTTSLTDGARFVSRKTDIYYIQEADTALFIPVPAPSTPKLKDMRISGDSK